MLEINFAWGRAPVPFLDVVFDHPLDGRGVVSVNKPAAVVRLEGAQPPSQPLPVASDGLQREGWRRINHGMQMAVQSFAVLGHLAIDAAHPAAHGPERLALPQLHEAIAQLGERAAEIPAVPRAHRENDNVGTRSLHSLDGGSGLLTLYADLKLGATRTMLIATASPVGRVGGWRSTGAYPRRQLLEVLLPVGELIGESFKLLCALLLKVSSPVERLMNPGRSFYRLGACVAGSQSEAAAWSCARACAARQSHSAVVVVLSCIATVLAVLRKNSGAVPLARHRPFCEHQVEPVDLGLSLQRGLAYDWRRWLVRAGPLRRREHYAVRIFAASAALIATRSPSARDGGPCLPNACHWHPLLDPVLVSGASTERHPTERESARDTSADPCESNLGSPRLTGPLRFF